MDYTYAITDFLNDSASADRLESEVLSSSITIQCMGCSVNSTSATIHFKAALSAEEKSTLDNIVMLHDGSPLPSKTSPTPVVIEPTGDLDKLLFMSGKKYDIATGTSNLDISFPEDRELQGAELFVVGNAIGDYIQVQLVHPLVGVVGTLAENLYVPPGGHIEVRGEATTSVPFGLIFRVVYTAVGTDPLTCMLSLRTWR